jgi:hypothetical protein
LFRLTHRSLISLCRLHVDTWGRQWAIQLATDVYDNVTESYFYAAAGRLKDTWREGGTPMRGTTTA